MRYDYSTHRTEGRAWAALEDMFADGQVSEGEKPKVECRNFRVPGRDGYTSETRYVITLAGA